MKESEVIIREKMKHDILSVISKYEKQFNAPISLTSAVINKIQFEIQAIEMQELLEGVIKDEQRANKRKEGERKSDSRDESCC